MLDLLASLPTRAWKQMHVLRDAPIAVLLLAAVCVSLTHLFYAERLAVMEQRLAFATESSRPASASPRQEPLPRYSLGGSPAGEHVLTFEEADQWVPARSHREVPLNWSELDGVRVTAEVRVWVRNFDEPGRDGWGQVRIKNVTDDTVVAEGARRPFAQAELQHLRIPRSTGHKVYRVEILGERRSISIHWDIVLTREPAI